MSKSNIKKIYHNFIHAFPILFLFFLAFTGLDLSFFLSNLSIVLLMISLVMIFLFGFPEKMELIDELVVLVLLLASIRYMWRIILICRVYSILPKRAPENSSRRRLF